jgi:hypothetical protein
MAVTLKEYSHLPLCPKCGNTLWGKPCGRCKALTPNPEAVKIGLFLRVVTGRLRPVEPCQ